MSDDEAITLHLLNPMSKEARKILESTRYTLNSTIEEIVRSPKKGHLTPIQDEDDLSEPGEKTARKGICKAGRRKSTRPNALHQQKQPVQLAYMGDNQNREKVIIKEKFATHYINSKN